MVELKNNFLIDSRDQNIFHRLHGISFLTTYIIVLYKNIFNLLVKTIFQSKYV